MATTTTDKFDLLKLVNGLNCTYRDGVMFFVKTEKDTSSDEDSDDPYSPYSADQPAHVHVKVRRFDIGCLVATVDYLPNPERIIDVLVTLYRVRLDVTHNLPRFRHCHVHDILDACAGTLAGVLEETIERFLTARYAGNTFRVSARCNSPVFDWKRAFAEDIEIGVVSRNAADPRVRTVYRVDHDTGKVFLVDGGGDQEVHRNLGRVQPPDDVEEGIDYILQAAEVAVDHDDIRVVLQGGVMDSDSDEEFQDAEDEDEDEDMSDGS
jgi:hypothetical protein